MPRNYAYSFHNGNQGSWFSRHRRLIQEDNREVSYIESYARSSNTRRANLQNLFLINRLSRKSEHLRHPLPRRFHVAFVVV